jgi:hypothetical protein
MIQLMISEEERELLVDLLENERSDLRMEIADTDRRQYREMLRNRQALIRRIQQELEQAQVERVPL